MNLAPLLEAPVAIQVHVAAVLPAAIIGAFLLLWRRKGTPLHRTLGKIWLALMMVTSISSFFIHELNVIGGFSPIHLLSILTIAGCFRAYQTARAGNITAHVAVVRQLYFGGIVVAGAFTLLPHRIMSAVVFDGSSFIPVAGLVLAVLLPWLLFYLLQDRKLRLTF
ncbi:DUF2306 domain-containing protein [Rhizobium oryzicola]|uniref:DUF2306 domain-containing protein n=1 Tax=Rhizobium oryzicola TaxID=1232668 RepID=A0ABT8SVB5_9HYPH|nr:DUF2306 domain-containing protein [Rhizobium oryzicola]MDO1582377.1 DUF2306 domain-containing protein [Rhizobium oryzicola]